VKVPVEVKAFCWGVLFPLLPLVLGFFAALGCDLAGVPFFPWWIPVFVLTILAYAWACWYGQSKMWKL